MTADDGVLTDLSLLKITYDKTQITELMQSKAEKVLVAKNILLVSDTDNHCVRAIDLDSKMISVIAGKCGEPDFKDGFTYTSRLRNPRSLGIDRRNRVYIDDFGNRQIRLLNFNSNFDTFKNFLASAFIVTIDKGSCFDLPVTYKYPKKRRLRATTRSGII